MLRRLKAGGNGNVFKDNMRGTKLVVLVKEDLGLQYFAEILMIHQIEIGSSKLFICSKVKKRGEVRG